MEIITMTINFLTLKNTQCCYRLWWSERPLKKIEANIYPATLTKQAWTIINKRFITRPKQDLLLQDKAGDRSKFFLIPVHKL